MYDTIQHSNITVNILTVWFIYVCSFVGYMSTKILFPLPLRKKNNSKKSDNAIFEVSVESPKYINFSQTHAINF